MGWLGLRLSWLVFAASLFGTPACAASVADFYRGKDIQFYIRAAPGGNYDVYSRLLGQYLTRFIPGHPNVLPINMPGGGGLVALNYVANAAPRDGTVLTMITQTFPMEQALGLDKNLDVDLRTLNWIGDMSDSNEFLFTARTSPTKTLKDAARRITPMAATGAGSITALLAALYNNLLGTRFKLIYGYPSGPAMSLAMERGEVEGRSTSNPDALGSTPAVVRADYNFLIQAGLEKARHYEDVPLLLDLAKGEDERQVFDFISKGVAISRPIVTNSGVPPARVAVLRRAFDETMSDPQFLADAKRLDLQISTMNGEDLQRLVFDLLDARASLRAEVTRAIEAKPADKAARPAQSGGGAE